MARIPKHEDPRLMSGQELEDYLDLLAQQGKDEGPEFDLAYAEWERRGDT